jgi:YggT family protein
MQVASALLFLIKTLSNLYILLFLLRVLLQWVRADYYNPFSQFVLRATNPLVAPARRLLPRSDAVDVPTLCVLIVLEALATWLLMSIVGFSVSLAVFSYYVLLRLVALLLWLYIVSIFIYVILSWVGPRSYSPIARVLGDLVNPALNVVRRFVPPIGGLDLSPLIVLILLQTVVILLPLPPFLK